MKLSTPLEWPTATVRTPKERRRKGAFRYDDTRITVSPAIRRLEESLDRMGGREATLSANFAVKATGGARKTAERGEIDPGVVLVFVRGATRYVMPCDTYKELADNVAALAAHLEAMRSIERYGVASLAQGLQAFAELPERAGGADWREVLGVSKDAPLEIVEVAYRVQAKRYHPDAPTGDAARFAAANEAIQQARAELGGAK